METPVTAKATAVDLLHSMAGNALPTHTDVIDAALADTDFDWHGLHDQAVAHGLMPLMYRHLLASGRFHVPPAFREALSEEFRNHAVSRFVFARRLRELLAQLEAADVEALPYKGPVAAIQLYGHYAARQYGDIDILVRPEQLHEAIRVLRGAGLRQTLALAESWQEHYLRENHALQWVEPATGLVVDLHWTLADRYQGWNIGPEFWFQDTVTVDLLGTSVRAMGPERLLLTLSVHAARSLWERLAWLGEIAQLIRVQPALNWALVFAEAERSGFTRAFHVNLELVRHHFDIELPEPWREQVAGDRTAARLAAALSADLRSGRGAPFGLLGKLRFGLGIRSSLGERLRYLRGLITHLSGHDLHRTRIPPQLAALFWITRPLRLLHKSLAERRRLQEQR